MKSARSIRDGDVHAFSELINHMSPIREFRNPFANLSPGVTRFEGCEGLVACLMNKQATTGGISTRHFLGIQQLLETAELGDVYRLPGLENSTGGSTAEKSDVDRLLRLLKSFDRYEAFRPKRELASDSTRDFPSFST